MGQGVSMRIWHRVMAVALLGATAGCTGLAPMTGLFTRKAPPEAAGAPLSATLPAPEAVQVSPLIGPEGQSVAALDTTSAAERAEATAPVAGGTSLGQTIASLGDPTEAGFWLRTPLVSAPAKGRVVAAGGASVAVDLLPLEGAPGAGSQISLSALRVLGIALTDLPELSVYRL